MQKITIIYGTTKLYALKMVYENMRKRQEVGRYSLLAAVMPSTGDGAGTDTF